MSRNRMARWALVACAALMASGWSGCATENQAKTAEGDGDKPGQSLAEAVKQEYQALALKNTCPKGPKDLQGAWRFAGRSKTPDFVDDLTVQGTRFSEELSGSPDGVATKATVTGEVRCLFRNRVLMMVDKVEPEGAFGNDSNTSYPCDVLNPMRSQDQNTIMLLCFFDWDLRPQAGRQFVYKLKNPPAK